MHACPNPCSPSFEQKKIAEAAEPSVCLIEGSLPLVLHESHSTSTRQKRPVSPHRPSEFSGTPCSKALKCSSSSSVSTLVFVELCAGSAKLSAAFRDVGFQVVAVDHKSNEHSQRVRCIEVDLSKPDAWSIISDMLSEDNIHHVHLGPPCGTASAARNRPVPKHLVRAGAPNPPPLRSRLHPMGLPGLNQMHLARVLNANRIYILCSKVVRLCVNKALW